MTVFCEPIVFASPIHLYIYTVAYVIIRMEVQNEIIEYR